MYISFLNNHNSRLFSVVPKKEKVLMQSIYVETKSMKKMHTLNMLVNMYTKTASTTSFFVLLLIFFALNLLNI